MSRPDGERLRDIQAACEAITKYVAREGTDDDLLFDAIRVRLIEIGEAVKDIDPKQLATEPTIPWTEISRMRDQLAGVRLGRGGDALRAESVNIRATS